MNTASDKQTNNSHKNTKPEAGVDYYFNENGYMVFTANYLIKRGYCCKNGCKHCPYGFIKTKNR